jgi:DNA replication protein DnaC
MLSQAQRAAILELHEQRVSKREIARVLRVSRLITTNLGYDEWQNFLGNKSMVEALLSRVRHYCHTVTVNGPSLREPQG